MAQFSKTWWGKRFIEALEAFSDSARLGRGRSYARNGKIKEYKIANGKITAKVRGSVNPYFGVYKEPLYSCQYSRHCGQERRQFPSFLAERCFFCRGNGRVVPACEGKKLRGVSRKVRIQT